MPPPEFRNPAFFMPAALAASPISPLNYCTSAKGLFDDTTRAQMTAAIDAYAKVCDKKTLALFFHGGLVKKQSGMDGAQRLFGPYSASSAPVPANGLTTDSWGDAYPYFFVWESGLLETLQHNLPGIVGEAIFRRVQDIVGVKAASILSPAAALSANVAMLSRMPTLDVVVPAGVTPTITQDDILEIQQAVEDDPIINAEKQRIAAAAQPVPQALSASLASPTGTVQTSPATLMSPQIVAAVAAEEAQRRHGAANLQGFSLGTFGTIALGAGNVLARIIQRYAQGRNHNFHNTVVEEIFRQFYVSNVGAAVWGEMKFETGQAFGSDPNCVGSAMIAELLRLYDSGDPGRKARITLIGHSTGAVYICNFLAAVDAALRGKPYAAEIQFDVIFMAGAVRTDVFAETLAKYAHRIRKFRWFGMHDALESTEILVQLDNPPNNTINAVLAQIYTSSLLYFITGCLEDRDDDTPLVGMERYYTATRPFTPGAFRAIDSVRTYFQLDPNSVVHSDTSALNPQPPLGMRSSSHHHGGFPGENAPNGNGGTLESVCYLLRTGGY